MKMSKISHALQKLLCLGVILMVSDTNALPEESNEWNNSQEGYCAPYNGKICKGYIKSPRSVW